MEYTQEQIDLLVQKEADRRVNQALEKRDKEHQTNLEKALADERIKIEEEISQKAKMTAEELAKKELEDKGKALSERENAFAIKENTLSAKELLIASGMPKENYENLLGMLVSDNAETTKTNVQNLINSYTKTKTDIENKVREEFTKVPPPRVGGNGELTKEQFNKLSYSEKYKLKSDNPELFKQLFK